MRSYVRGHWFGCSLRPGSWDAVKLTLDVGFICPFVVIGPTDEVATTVVAPRRMIDNFLPIPDAESLPLYRMVLKPACVCAYYVVYEQIIQYRVYYIYDIVCFGGHTI
jgi:hypothetical protein